MYRAATLAFFVLLANINLGDCIRCFVCVSSNDMRCKDPFNAGSDQLLTKECTDPTVSALNLQYIQPALRNLGAQINIAAQTYSSPKYCHKIVLPRGEVARTCMDGSSIDKNATCKELSRQGLYLQYCNSCDTDGCNGAATQTFSVLLGTMSLIAAYFVCRQ